MAKVTLSTITSGYQDANAINDNFTALATALENTVSRDGTTPNTFSADLDLNGNLILNQATNPTADSYNWEGDWATTTEYELNDLVFVTVATDATNGGATYICRIAHASGTFSTDYITNSYWDLVAERGASGEGSGDLVAANSLGDIASGGGSVATARTNLALGDAATFNEGIDASDQILTTNDVYTSTSLAIAGGTIIPVKAVHTITPESGTTDDLDEIDTTSIIDGGTVLIRCNDSGDTITIRDAVDNIYTRDSANITLDDTEKSVSFQRRGSDWYEVARSFEAIPITQVAVQPTTTGTSFDFSIPSGVKRIELLFQEVSLANVENFYVQLGTSSGIEDSGYTGSNSSFVNAAPPGVSNKTDAFLIISSEAAGETSGIVHLVLADEDNDTWVVCGVLSSGAGTNRMKVVAGRKSLALPLSTIRVKSSAGASFDNGSLSVVYS